MTVAMHATAGGVQFEPGFSHAV